MTREGRVIILTIILTFLTVLPGLIVFLGFSSWSFSMYSSFPLFKEVIPEMESFFIFMNLIIIKAMPGCRVNPKHFGAAVCEGGILGVFFDSLADILSVILSAGLVFLFWFLVIHAMDMVIAWLFDRD